MIRRIIVICCLGIALLGLASSPALAQEEAAKAAPKQAKAAPAEPASQAEEAQGDAVPVHVAFSGEDPLGMRLVFRMKEAFREAKGFRLVQAGERAMVLRVQTAVEFASRPHLGSAYAVSWTFSEGSDVLAYALDEAVGFVDDTTMAAVAATLVAETDDVVQRFVYLME